MRNLKSAMRVAAGSTSLRLCPGVRYSRKILARLFRLCSSSLYPHSRQQLIAQSHLPQPEGTATETFDCCNKREELKGCTHQWEGQLDEQSSGRVLAQDELDLRRAREPSAGRFELGRAHSRSLDYGSHLLCSDDHEPVSSGRSARQRLSALRA